MVNITHKNNTLRQAVAVATVQVSKAETIEKIENKLVPKGDIFEFARAAGLLAIKKTSDVIPDCHPLPVEFAQISYKIEGLSIEIRVEVHTIYKTGVEVEAMHGAAITALTMYDMLKPIDKGVEIQNIKLLSKKGGKSDLKNFDASGLSAAVVVCSDTIFQGKNQDTAGATIAQKLTNLGISVSEISIVPDEVLAIQNKLNALKINEIQLAIFTGGTGLSPRDVTPDAIRPLLDREIAGIMENARNYGQNRTPFAMLSRSVAGFSGGTLVLTFPGSLNAANEYFEALFPQILHVFKVVRGERH